MWSAERTDNMFRAGRVNWACCHSVTVSHTAICRSVASMPPTPLLHSSAIIADPHISSIISSIQQASQNTLPSPARRDHRSPQVIEIEDSSDEDIVHSSAVPPTPSSTRSRKRPERVVVITTSDEDEDVPFPPRSTTHYQEFDDTDRQLMTDALSRASKRAEAKDEKKRRQVSSSSYADDGTLELIANLTLDENDGKFFTISQ